MSIFKDTAAGYRRLPSRNKKILNAFSFVAVLVVGTTSYLLFGGGGESAVNKGGPARAVNSRATSANTPATSGEINASQEYLEAKKVLEEKRMAEAKKNKESYTPGVRQNYVPEEGGPQSLSLTPPPSEPGKATSNNILSSGQCESAEGVGMKLANGDCVMPNGNVYNSSGALITERTQVVKSDKDEVVNGIKIDANGNRVRVLTTKQREKALKGISGYLASLSKGQEERTKPPTSSASKDKDKKSDSDKLSERDKKIAEAVEEKKPDDAMAKTHGYNPGDLAVGILDTSINSDTPSIIRVVPAFGVLEGGVYTGTVELSGDRVIASLKTFTWRGHTTTIKAVLVDPDTKVASLQGDVDTHLFSRLSTAFLYGTGVAAAELLPTAGGAVTTTSTSSTTTTPQPTVEDLALVGVGQTAKLLEDPIKKIITRPPTVTVTQNTLVGILFTEKQEIPWLPEEAMSEVLDATR